MKIEKPCVDNGGSWYVYFDKEGNVFMHLINEWEQIFGNWNWYTCTPIKFEFENEVMTGGWTLEIILLGIGFRLRWNYAFEESEAGKKIQEIKDGEGLDDFLKKLDEQNDETERLNKSE